MKHARDDYHRIQDPDNKIPADEPVFLLRGQDVSAPSALEFWATQNIKNGGDDRLSQLALAQADLMREWQRKVKRKPADL